MVRCGEDWRREVKTHMRADEMLAESEKGKVKL